MFNNIGKKIKVLAKVLCWIGIIGSILSGLFVIIMGIVYGVAIGSIGSALSRSYYSYYNSYSSAASSSAMIASILSGLLIAAGGALSSWIANFLLYGFGELIDKTADNENNTAEILRIVRNMSNVQSASSFAAGSAQSSGSNMADYFTPAPPSEAESQTVVITASDYTEDGNFICPVCKSQNRDNRQFCWNCNSLFTKQ